MTLSAKIKLTLPYPPSVNHIYATDRNGTRRLTEIGKGYKNGVLGLLLQAKARPFSKDVSMRISVYRPRKIGDLDNVLKIVQDSLKGSCFEDDKQITEIHAFRFDDKSNPRVEVEISEI